VVEGAVEGRHRQVVAREAELRLGGQAVVLDRPLGEALALEALAVEVLVEVEQREDVVAGERVQRAPDLREVVIVVAPRPRLDPGVDDAEADRIEPVSREEGRVRPSKPAASGS
jgi:hypothetical protein